MLRIEYYSSKEEAVTKLTGILNDVTNMIIRINTTIEYVKGQEAKTVSRGIVNVKSYSVIDRRGRRLYELRYIGLVGNIDYESLEQLRDYYVTLRDTLTTLINSMSRMDLRGPLAIVYLNEAPVILIHSINEEAKALISELINQLA